MSPTPVTSSAPITCEQLLKHWQDHRRLTRKMIEVFPDDKLFTYSIGGMRPFSDMILEMLGMGVPGVQGMATGEWQKEPEILGLIKPSTKKELLKQWDETTSGIDRLFPTITCERFQQDDVAYGQWAGKVYWFLLYFIDNEIHHRAQGYVYLRSLGIEPPAFWDRS
jgi:uncharacterized damage-inducible protein DinB